MDTGGGGEEEEEGVTSTGVKRPLRETDIFLGALAKSRKATVSFFVTAIRLYVCIYSSLTVHIFGKFGIGDHFENCRENSRFVQFRGTILDALREDLSTLVLFQITTNTMQRFSIYLFLQTLYKFQAVPPPIIRST